jgi:hypothetical protein
VPQPPERCLSRKAGIMRCCLKCNPKIKTEYTKKNLPASPHHTGKTGRYYYFMG